MGTLKGSLLFFLSSTKCSETEGRLVSRVAAVHGPKHRADRSAGAVDPWQWTYSWGNEAQRS